MEPGLIEHFGASAGRGCTEQENVTESPNPSIAFTSTVDVDDPPGLTVLGVSMEAESTNSGAMVSLNTTPQPPSPHTSVLPPAPVVP